MSSYICSPKHFNSIEYTLIERFKYNRNDYFDYNFSKDVQVVRDYVDSLREINVLCVILQYKHHYVGVLDEQIEAERFFLKEKTSKKLLNDFQLLKALECLSYQIEINYLKELRGLTELEQSSLDFLSGIKNTVRRKIINNLSEYNNAEWEIN